MKKFCALLSILLLLGMATSVYAAEANDDLSGLTEEIVTTSNDLFADKLNREITSTDIDYNNAFKIYVGTDIFKTDITKIDEIPATFGNNGYIYELPIYIDGSTLIINIAKGKALNENAEFTEDEYQNIQNNVGKWQVTAIKYYADEIVNYTTELENRIGTDAKDTVLVGGLPYFRYAVALLSNDSGDIAGFVPLSDVPGIENISTLRSDSENIYNYAEIKEYVNQLPESADDEAGAYGFLDSVPVQKSFNYVVIICGIIILSIIGGGVFVLHHKKSKLRGEKI